MTADSAPPSSRSSSKQPAAEVDVNDGACFFRISIASLRTGVPLGFRVFAKVGGERIIFVRTGQVFTRNHCLTLSGSGQNDVHIPLVDRPAYCKYLESNIVDILTQDFADPVEQLQQYYGVGEVVTRELISDPGDPTARTLASEWVGHSSELLVGGSDRESSVMAGMVKVMEVAPDLYQHSMHVCLYGLALAQELAVYGSTDLTDFGLGLLLHDIGLLGMADITSKGDGLSPVDREIIEGHPRVGYDRVQSLNWIGGIGRDVILHHHERLDGQGYPNRIAPRDLSIGARIAAVVNTFDSRTTTRPYRDAEPSMAVLKYMIDDGRAAFDPRVLATFVRMLSN